MRCGSNVSDVVRLYGQGQSDKGDLNLTLLRQIDETVNWLASMRNEAASGVGMGAQILQTLTSCTRERPIDPDGKLRDLYAQVESKLKEAVDILRRKRASAQRDTRLPNHHAESLVGEFDGAIGAISELHDIIVSMRWAVAEYDADLEKPVGTAHASAEDFLKSLKA